MRTSLFAAAVVSAAMASAACSDGTGPGSGGDQLTASEARQLHQAMFDLSAGVRNQPGIGFSRAATGMGSGTFTFNFQDTAPCEPSGDVDLDGIISVTFDEAEQTNGLSADIEVKHNDCAHVLDSGDVIRLTGDPDIDVTMDAAGGPDGIESLTVTERGAFTWVRDGGFSGRCEVDVTADLDPATGAVHVDGTFCGVDVSGTYTES